MEYDYWSEPYRINDELLVGYPLYRDCGGSIEWVDDECHLLDNDYNVLARLSQEEMGKLVEELKITAKTQ